MLKTVAVASSTILHALPRYARYSYECRYGRTPLVLIDSFLSQSQLATMDQQPVQIGQYVLGKNLGIGAFGKVRFGFEQSLFWRHHLALNSPCTYWHHLTFIFHIQQNTRVKFAWDA